MKHIYIKFPDNPGHGTKDVHAYEIPIESVSTKHLDCLILYFKLKTVFNSDASDITQYCM